MYIDKFSSGKGYSWKPQIVPPYFSWPMSSGYDDSTPTWYPWVSQDVLTGGSPHSSSPFPPHEQGPETSWVSPPPRLNKVDRVVGGGPRRYSTSCVSSPIPSCQESLAGGGLTPLLKGSEMLWLDALLSPGRCQQNQVEPAVHPVLQWGCVLSAPHAGTLVGPTGKLNIHTYPVLMLHLNRQVP